MRRSKLSALGFIHVGRAVAGTGIVFSCVAADAHLMDRRPFRDQRFDEADRLHAEAKALLETFDGESDIAILGDALDMLAEASECAGSRHPMLRLILQDLDRADSKYFQYTGKKPYIDILINVLRASGRQFPKSDLDRAWYLSTLGMAHTNRYRILHRDQDIDEAVRLAQLSVNHKPPHPGHRKMTLNLVSWLFLRGQTHPPPGDLSRAVGIAKTALSECPIDDPDRANVLQVLSSILLEQFKRTSKEEHLQDAISYAEEAIDAKDDEDPELPAALHGLGELLLEKYNVDGKSKGLNRAIDVMNECIDCVPSHSAFASAAKQSLASLL